MTTTMSASPSTSTREKKVYVCVEQFSEDVDVISTMVWYVININNNSEEEVELLSHVFEQVSNSPIIPEFVAWRSFIFSIGGRVLKENGSDEYRPCSDVFYIDTRFPQKGWTRGPSLKQARRNPHCVVYDDGKICALGGSKNLSIYAESIIPFSNSRWYAMDMGPDQHEAPFRFLGHSMCQRERKLFLQGNYSESLHCYDFDTKIWTTIEKNNFKWQYPCAPIDDIMYLVEGGKFMGFDLITHQWYKGVGLEEDYRILPPYVHKGNGLGIPSSLVHIGNGTLCLLWIGTVLAGFRAIHCTKFTVRKEYDDTKSCFIIKASVKFFKVYSITGGFLLGSVAVDTGEESDHDKEEDGEEESARDKGSAKGDRKLPRKKKKKKKNRKIPRSQQKIGN